MNYFASFKVLNRLLLSLLALFFNASLLHAEHSLQARVSGLDQIQELKHQKSTPKLIFQVRIPGLGRSLIKLNKVRDFNIQPIFTDQAGKITKDLTKPRFFRGEFKSKTKKQSIAASLISLKSKDYLVLSLSAANPRTGKQRFHKLKILADQSNPTSSRAYRLSKLSHELFGEDQLSANFHTPEIAPQATPRRKIVAQATYQQVSLSLDADRFWYEIYGQDSNSVLTSFINEAESIYQTDHGVTFQIVRQNIFTGRTFGTTNAVDRLCNFQYYVYGASTLTDSGCTLSAPKGPQSYYGSADAYHLFTGQDMDSSTIGLAFLGSVCRSLSYSFGVTQLTSTSVTPITFAHELGHNFAAIHDNSSGYNGIRNATCPATSIPNIMGSVISFNPPEHFSNCSKTLVAELVNGFGSCLETVNEDSTPPDGGDPVSPTPTPTPTSPPSNDPNSPGEPTDPTTDVTFTLKFLETGKLSGILMLPQTIDISDYQSCSIQIAVSDSKNNFINASFSTLPVNQSIYSLTAANKSKVAPNLQGRIKPIFIQANLLCDGSQVATSAIKKIATKKIVSNQSQEIGAFVKRISKRIRIT